MSELLASRPPCLALPSHSPMPSVCPTCHGRPNCSAQSRTCSKCGGPHNVSYRGLYLTNKFEFDVPIFRLKQTGSRRGFSLTPYSSPFPLLPKMSLHFPKYLFIPRLPSPSSIFFLLNPEAPISTAIPDTPISTSPVPPPPRSAFHPFSYCILSYISFSINPSNG